jgi:hypothetical protein
MRTRIVIAIALAAVSVGAAAQEDLSDLELLQAFDDLRFFDDDVTSLRVRIVSTRADDVDEAEVLLLFAEIDGEDYTRIEFLTNEDVLGRIFLTTPEGTFFYGPDLDEPIPFEDNQTVFGDSPVAQTAGIRFVADYSVVARRTVTGEDGSVTLEMDLVAVDLAVAFQRTTVTADMDTLQPLSVVLYSVSGLPFYEVYFEEYVTRAEGDVYVSVQRIENRIFEAQTTISEILEIGTDELDPLLFDPSQLGG